MTERFTLLEKIGRGGMGVVWRARDEENGSIVAVKLLHSAYSDDPDYVTRFERELELARRIASANVVGVLGYGVREGTPYLVLEYVEGKSLRENLSTHGPYTWDETKPLLIQIAQGLTDAHAAGVVHRDIKPSNILIRSDGVAKIADFGIARGLDLTRVTGTSTLLGTPAYLPPEGPQDERSDLYSLGIVTYELLAGVPPFEGSTYAEVLMAHVRLAPDLERLPAEARPVVGWLLDKDPKLRPQSAAELIDALSGKRKVPALAAVAPAALAEADAEQATRPLRPSVETSADRRDRAHRRRRVGVALLLSAFVVVLAAAAVWGAQGGFGAGPQPTSSGLIAAGGAEQPTGQATADSFALATSTGLMVTITPLGSSTGAGPTGGVTPGGATRTPAANPTPTPKPVTPAPVTPTPAPPTPAPPTPQATPITAPPVTQPPITAPPVTAPPVTAPPITAPPPTPALSPTPAGIQLQWSFGGTRGAYGATTFPNKTTLTGLGGTFTVNADTSNCAILFAEVAFAQPGPAYPMARWDLTRGASGTIINVVANILGSETSTGPDETLWAGVTCLDGNHNELQSLPFSGSVTLLSGP